MAKKAGHFGPELFAFLGELAANNRREWFLANKERFERDVRDPLLAFITDFAPRLRTISPHFVADPRPVGGSLFRIYKDTRFAKDKTPYKTHAAAQFRHESAKDVHAPGFYLHLEPGQVFAGSGLWHPEGDVLARVRAAIVDDAAGWKRATRGIALGGEALKRPPSGFDPAHPMIEDLKRKDFVTMVELSQRDALGSAFLDQFTDACRAAAPMMKFLTRAVGLPY